MFVEQDLAEFIQSTVKDIYFGCCLLQVVPNDEWLKAEELSSSKEEKKEEEAKEKTEEVVLLIPCCSCCAS